MSETAQAVPGPEREGPTPGSDGQQNGTILEAVQLSKIFGGLVAVDAVTFSVPRKSIVSIIGPNGAGKTTFFNMLTGVYTPTSGEILFNGHDVAGLPPHAV